MFIVDFDNDTRPQATCHVRLLEWVLIVYLLYDMIRCTLLHSIAHDTRRRALPLLDKINVFRK